MYKNIQTKKYMEIAWYIKLNILLMGFIFIIFIIKKTKTSAFRQTLYNMYSIPKHVSPEIPANIKISIKRQKKSSSIK